MEPILEFDSGTVTLTGAAPESLCSAMTSVPGICAGAPATMPIS